TTGRLAGKIAVITGAAGNLGTEIVRHYLREGAIVVMTGRTPDRTEAARAAIVAELGVPDAQAAIATLDGADPQSVRAGIADIVARYGRIDILVNNAGSAGPKQVLEELPMSNADLLALQKAGSTDSETVADAVRNIFGVIWNVARTAAPHMGPGSSMINVSTIFSRTPYYGRTAYVVPKAAVNALSRELSLELGPKGIRVNLLFPGPIESARIRGVFAAMDKLKGEPADSTANHFMGIMSLDRAEAGEAPTRRLPLPKDIANTCVFLGSDESAAFNGHDFEVTHGMTVRKEERSVYLSRPTMRSMDGTGLAVLIAGGEQWEDALEIARVQVGAGAHVLLGLSRQADVAMTEARLKAEGAAERMTVVRFNRGDAAGMGSTLELFTDENLPITSAIILPAKPPLEFQGTLVDASDAVVDAVMDLEISGNIALARTLSRYWKRHDNLLQPPRYVFLSNRTDGNGNITNNLLRAATEQLIRVW
ncbi:MAG: SDR family NAD(P)-dependent oxidoreductase, partial [Sandaracinobacteroides sp.]